MAKIEIPIDDEQMEAIFEGRGLAALLRPVLNELLEAELTEHIGAERHDRTDERTGRRNGHYTRELTTRVGPIELGVPRDREGNFDTDLFDRYQRSEKRSSRRSEPQGPRDHGIPRNTETRWTRKAPNPQIHGVTATLRGPRNTSQKPQ